MLQMNRLHKEKNTKQINIMGWKYSMGVRWGLFLCLTLLFYFGLAPSILPEKLDIEVNVKSEQDIIAPIQFPDKKATLKAQEQAAERVQPIYEIISIKNERLMDILLDRIDQLNDDDAISAWQKVTLYRTVIPELVSKYVRDFIMHNRNKGTYSAPLLDEMSKRINEQKYDLPEETYVKISRLSKEDLVQMKPIARKLVSKLMGDAVLEAAVSRAKVPEYVNMSSLNKRIVREVVQELVRLCVMPNKFYDDQTTKEEKVQAREKTPQVFVQQGDRFIKQGQIISEEIYDLLKENDLLKTEVNYGPQIGLFALATLFSLGLFMFMRQTGKQTYFSFNNSQLLMFILICGLHIIMLHMINYAQTKEVPYIGYVTPVAMGVVLITLLLDLSLAYISAVVFSIMAGIVLNSAQGILFDFHFGLFALVSCYAAIFASYRVSQRATILKAGIMVCIFGSITVLILSILKGEALQQSDMMMAITFAFTSGLLMSVLVLGFMPFFEVTFGILSSFKMVELSNPNHPLLRKLLTETPGTYHHSVMVANLAEQAAESIGANGLLCRVGAYYHDIGKTKKPSYFIENQTNMDNPHNYLEPQISAEIIIAHARDGVDMLQDYKLPKPIRDIAEQHHGTTLLKYFYYKELEQAETKGIAPDFTEQDFRYLGPKAQSKEIAIVGIADCVEAAVRSLRHPTVELIQSMIHKIVKDRTEDQQFNECDLTLRELDIISQSLKETVMGIFHARIEYPDDTKKE